MNQAARARPAQFDRAQQRRKSLISKIHVAKKMLRLDEETYRAVLFEVTGTMSSADCTVQQLLDLVHRFEARGFKSAPPKVGKRPSADHPVARKARAMWISLYNLAAIDNPTEAALEAFARRKLSVTAMQWMDQSLCYKLIEPLKAIAERHGWVQHKDLRVLKLNLLDAILAKLKAAQVAGESWTVEEAAYRLCAIESGELRQRAWSVEQLDEVAGALGAKLRDDRP